MRAAGFLLILVLIASPGVAEGATRSATPGRPSRAAALALTQGGVARAPYVGLGTNKPQLVTFRGTRTRAIFKAVSRENRQLVAEVGGSLVSREVGAFKLSRAMGLELVPHTIEREIKGELGSLQLFVETPKGASSTRSPISGALHWGVEFDRTASEQLRVFDNVIENTDRRGDNTLVRKVGSTYHPVAIDNGYGLSTRGPGMKTITPFGANEHRGPLTADTRAWIAGLDLGKAARALRQAGVERQAITMAMRRLWRVKKDPSFLETHGTNYGAFLATHERLNRLLRRADQELEAKELEAVDAIVARAWGTGALLARASGRGQRGGEGGPEPRALEAHD